MIVYAVQSNSKLHRDTIEESSGLADVKVVVERLGHRDAAVRQVLHQVQVKRQLLGRQALEQCEHEFTLRAGEEVVGVFNPALNATQFDQLANLQAAQHFACIFFGDFGKNGHRSAQRGKSRGGGKGASQSQGISSGASNAARAQAPARVQNFITFQTRGAVLVSAPLLLPLRLRAPSGDFTS